MQIGTFRKNVMKTVNAKTAKAGLRRLASNTQRTNIFQTTVAVRTDMGRLLSALRPVVLGEQFTAAMEATASPAFGDLGASLVALAKLLKVKTPTSTKKAKLVGTRTLGLMELDQVTTEALGVAQGIFTGPVTLTVNKEITLPSTGEKVKRDVQEVDKEKEEAAEAGRITELQSLITKAVDLYWRLSLDIFKSAPAPMFAAKMDRLKAAYPSVQFETEPVKEAKPETAKEAVTA